MSRLDAAGFEHMPSQQIVLTGGGSQIMGLDGLATRILGQRVRLGRPLRVHGLPQSATGPGFSSAVGLSLFAAHPQGRMVGFRNSGRHLCGAPLQTRGPVVSVTIGKIVCRVILGAAFFPGWVSAQTVITPQAFLDAVVGKTLQFHEIRSGELVGTEQFLNRTVSVWREEGRGCVYGQITTPNGRICFLYDNDPDGVPVLLVALPA